MQTLERTVRIDRDLARRADRKLKRYGRSFDDAVAFTLAYIVNQRGNPIPNEVRANGDMAFDNVEDAIGFLHAQI